MIYTNDIYYMKLNYTLNEHYFDSIDTEEKAYWLGFLYADGCISNNSIYFGQAENRADIVHKFIKALSITKPIKISYPKIGKPFYNCQIVSKIFFNRLKELGCIPNKSLILTFNPDIIPKQFINSFIRGYFDGDGCIWEGKRKIMLVKDNQRKSGNRERIIHNVKFTITGNYNFIINLQDYLCIQLGFKKTKLNFSKSKIKKNICTMEYSGRRQVKKFFDYIYNNATTYETNKRKKFENIICASTEKSVVETALIEETPEMVIVSQAA